MQIGRIGFGIFIFCVAFLLGFSAVEYLVPGNTEETVIQQTTVEFAQPPVEQETSQPPCKKFAGDLSLTNSREESGAVVSVPKALKSSHQKSGMRKADEKKFSDLEREFQELDKIMRDEQKRERKSTHTLLYVKDCSEYNESR